MQNYFSDNAERYLEPRYHEPTVVDEVRREEDTERDVEIDNQTKTIVGGIAGNSPADGGYDYRGAVSEGVTFNPNDDGGIDFPNGYIKPLELEVAGYDISTGTKYKNTFEDQQNLIFEGVTQLGQSKQNNKRGVPIEDTSALTRIAKGVYSEGFDYNVFKENVPGSWPEHYKMAAWRATEASSVREAYKSGELNYDYLPEPPEQKFSQTYSEDDLAVNEYWLQDLGTMYQDIEDKPFTGTPIELHEWGTDLMSQLTSPTYGAMLISRALFAPEETKQAMYRVNTVYQGTDLSMSQFGRSLKHNVMDPTNLVGLTGLGLTGTAATRAASHVALKHLNKVLFSSVMKTGALGAVEGAAWAGLDDFYQQSIGMQADRQEGYDVERGAEAATMGAAGGAVLGGGIAKAADPKTREFVSKLFYQANENLHRGGMVVPGTRRAQYGMVAWHGSPHKHSGRLDPTKIGTGEGAQAYGYGHYLAENPEVAGQYRAQLSDGYDVKINGVVAKDEARVAGDRINQYGYKKALEYAEADAFHGGRKEGAILAHTKGLKGSKIDIEEAGALYEYDLPDNVIGDMLDWDAPLSEQPESVRKALGFKSNSLLDKFTQYKKSLVKKYGQSASGWAKRTPEEIEKFNSLKRMAGDSVGSDITGKQAYEKLVNKYSMTTGGALGRTPTGGAGGKASAELQKLGIPGIKYYDGGSRAAGEGTRNFVVFPGNEDLVKVKSRNGKPVND